jgi:hypothetical protein
MRYNLVTFALTLALAATAVGCKEKWERDMVRSCNETCDSSVYDCRELCDCAIEKVRESGLIAKSNQDLSPTDQAEVNRMASSCI